MPVEVRFWPYLIAVRASETPSVQVFFLGFAEEVRDERHPVAVFYAFAERSREHLAFYGGSLDETIIRSCSMRRIHKRVRRELQRYLYVSVKAALAFRKPVQTRYAGFRKA